MVTKKQFFLSKLYTTLDALEYANIAKKSANIKRKGANSY